MSNYNRRRLIAYTKKFNDIGHIIDNIQNWDKEQIENLQIKKEYKKGLLYIKEDNVLEILQKNILDTIIEIKDSRIFEIRKWCGDEMVLNRRALTYTVNKDEYFLYDGANFHCDSFVCELNRDIVDNYSEIIIKSDNYCLIMETLNMYRFGDI